jgi:hypothetical protein
MLANFSGEMYIVPKATVLGIAEEVSEELENRVKPNRCPTLTAQQDHRENERTNACTVTYYKENSIT